MRYIDMRRLNLSADWSGRAKKAADAVRGPDPVRGPLTPAERSKKIGEFQELWKELKEQLLELSHGKCWYCESMDPRSDNAVDHYRPKGNVKDASPAHDGYWWLAFKWSNYRFSCTYCNSIRKSAKTVGGKQDYFPLWDEAKRAREEDDPLLDEIPLLIDPASAQDIRLIAFAEDGTVGPTVSEQEDALKHAMGKATIKRYHLDHPTLNNMRYAVLKDVSDWIKEADDNLAQFAKKRDGQSRATASSRISDAARAASEHAVYSMAVKHLLAGLKAANSEAAKSALEV
jgi:uncharacterized protein (TIGR02646 family)